MPNPAPEDLFAGLPDQSALRQAVELQRLAAGQGFDWPDAEAVWLKIEEELDELRAGVAAGDAANIEEEIGDVLFAMSNLARKLGVDPEAALRKSNDKFVRRYRGMQAVAAERGLRLADLPLDQQVAIYQEARARLG